MKGFRRQDLYKAVMVDKDRVRRSYDDLAATYAAARSDDSDDVVVLDEFLDRLSAPAKVLDAGCGQGTPVLRRLTDSNTAIGLDTSTGQLQLAAERVPTAPLVQGDIAALPFRDEVFDVVVAYYSLIHLPLDEHQTALDEFARVVRSKGWVLLSEGAGTWEGSNPDWLGSGIEMQWSVAGAEATRRHLRAAGFEIVAEWQVADTVADEAGSFDPFFAARLGP